MRNLRELEFVCHHTNQLLALNSLVHLQCLRLTVREWSRLPPTVEVEVAPLNALRSLILSLPNILLNSSLSRILKFCPYIELLSITIRYDRLAKVGINTISSWSDDLRISDITCHPYSSTLQYLSVIFETFRNGPATKIERKSRAQIMVDCQFELSKLAMALSMKTSLCLPILKMIGLVCIYSDRGPPIPLASELWNFRGEEELTAKFGNWRGLEAVHFIENLHLNSNVSPCFNENYI